MNIEVAAEVLAHKVTWPHEATEDKLGEVWYDPTTDEVLLCVEIRDRQYEWVSLINNAAYGPVLGHRSFKVEASLVVEVAE